MVWGGWRLPLFLQDGDRLRGQRQERHFLRGWENLPDSDLSSEKGSICQSCPRMGTSTFRGDERVVAVGLRRQMDRMTSRSCFCHSGTLCLRKLGVHSFSGVWLSDPQGQDAVLPRAPSGDAPTGRGVLSPGLEGGQSCPASPLLPGQALDICEAWLSDLGNGDGQLVLPQWAVCHQGQMRESMQRLLRCQAHSKCSVNADCAAQPVLKTLSSFEAGKLMQTSWPSNLNLHAWPEGLQRTALRGRVATIKHKFK